MEYKITHYVDLEVGTVVKFVGQVTFEDNVIAISGDLAMITQADLRKITMTLFPTDLQGVVTGEQIDIVLELSPATGVLWDHFLRNIIHAGPCDMHEAQLSYDYWDREDLIAVIAFLEDQLNDLR